MDICKHCGAELIVGEWPFCPHGIPGGNAIQTDEAFIGGRVIENLGHEPVTVYSRQEFNEQMARHGVEQRIKYVPGDHYLQNCGNYIDAKTLDNVRVLLSRGK